MSTHKNDGSDHGLWQEPEDHSAEEIDASKGYEATDVRVSGVVVFLVALGIFAAVTGVLAYGIGKVINARMAKEDGPPSRWSRTVDLRPLGDMPNNPEMQNKVAQLAQQFPEPRLQLDDGYQEIADMHAREDLLLNNYSWIDRSKGTVRIPIDQAILIIAQRGLPVAPATTQAPLLVGDSRPAVHAPLTNGFARTGYEQDQRRDEEIEDARGKQQ